MSTQDGGTSSEADGLPLSVRAQLLATEHWSLLASRSTTQGDLLIGLLTQVRVLNVAMEDLMYVLAMNGLRAAYADLDPGIAKYMLAGRHDDEPGMDQAYYFLGGRSAWSHVAGSSMVFITMPNAALTAILLGTFMTLLGWPIPVAVLVGSGCGLAFAGATSFHGYRQYRDVWQRFTPLSPTPPGGD